MGTHLARGAAVLALVVAPLAAQEIVTSAGKTAVISLHPGKLDTALAASLADDALAAAEAVRPLLEKWGLAPAKPVVVHVYADVAAYRAAEKRAASHKFLVEDFCAADGSEAHVLVHPPVPGSILTWLGLPPGTARAVQRWTAALAAMAEHEAARKDPWLADVVGFAALDATFNPKGSYGIDPDYDGRRSIYSRHFAAGHAPSLDSMCSESRHQTRGEYDVALAKATLVGQLCSGTGSGWARKFFAKLPVEPQRAEARRARIDAVLGKDAAKNEQRFGRMCGTLKPVWSRGHGVSVRDGKLLLVGAEGDTAYIEAEALPPEGSCAIRAKMELLPGGGRECRFALGESETEVVAALIDEQRCAISVWSSETKKWTVLATGPSPDPLDGVIDVSVEVTDVVRLLLDGKEIVSAPRGGRELELSWGVHVNETLVTLENLRCEPLAPAKKK